MERPLAQKPSCFVKDFNMGAMENKSLNVFNTSLTLAREDTATDDDYERIEGVIGHEYFHNWTWFSSCYPNCAKLRNCSISGLDSQQTATSVILENKLMSTLQQRQRQDWESCDLPRLVSADSKGVQPGLKGCGSSRLCSDWRDTGQESE